MIRPMARAAVVMLLVSACSGQSPTPSSEGPVSDAPSAPPSVAPSEPAASERGTSGCQPPVLCADVLAPGEYSAATATTEVTFTVGEGWIGTAYEDLGFDLVLAEGDESARAVMSAVPYGGVIYTDVCSGEETEEIGTTAADFVAFIAERDGITPRGGAVEVTVGGVSGRQIDVDATDPGCESEPPDRNWLWDLGGVTDFHLNVGEAARLIALDTEAGVTVFVIETFDPATFEAFLDAVQPVLDSMTFD